MERKSKHGSLETRRAEFESRINNLVKLEVTKQTKEYNQYRIEPTYLQFNDVGVNAFNNIIDIIHDMNMSYIVRTKSGGISNTSNSSLINCYAYDVRHSTSRISITILFGDHTYNIVMGKPIELRPISPINAWKKFIEVCEKHNINFDDYKISKEEGKIIAKDIVDNVKPYISMKYHMLETDKLLDNVHHLDLHSSYPSGLIKMYPEFRPVIQEIYDNRKTDKENSDYYKAILNYVISGCTMSKYYPWYRQWAHIAKFVREYNNQRINLLTLLLEMSGREIIGYNTDGIWYRGEIYHGPDEGSNLLEWDNDHKDCLFRSKSDGAYEFIEDGKYHVTMRGFTTLDIIKPDRDTWELGDIYKTGIKEYIFDEESEKIYEV